MRGLHLRHDVLDEQLVDRHQKKIGRVDALALELRDGQPPRVATIIVGGPARRERMGRPFTWISAVMRTLKRSGEEGVSRIPFRAMRRLGDCIEVDVEEKELASEHLERWLAAHVVCRIPGASGGKN